jgi:hypothetical protein
VRAAEQTPGSFLKGMVVNGYRFTTMIDREARQVGALPPSEIVERLDIRRPLGLSHEPNPDALRALLAMYAASNFPLGGRKRVA